MTGASDESYLTTAEVARRLGVKPETVYAYVSRGLLTSVRARGRRGSLFAARDIDRLAERGGESSGMVETHPDRPDTADGRQAVLPRAPGQRAGHHPDGRIGRSAALDRGAQRPAGLPGAGAAGRAGAISSGGRAGDGPPDRSVADRCRGAGRRRPAALRSRTGGGRAGRRPAARRTRRGSARRRVDRVVRRNAGWAVVAEAVPGSRPARTAGRHTDPDGRSRARRLHGGRTGRRERPREPVRRRVGRPGRTRRPVPRRGQYARLPVPR